MNNIPFWDTVVTNAAPIIIALTGFGAMAGGFYMQYRMMKQQNKKLDRNAEKADQDRAEILSTVQNGKKDDGLHP